MPTFSRRQHKFATGNPASATFDSAPVAGNLLVAYAWQRGAGEEPTISGSGWTQIFNIEYLPGPGTDFRRWMVCYYKTAGASEPSNIEIDMGVTAALLIQEFSSNIAVDWAFEDWAVGHVNTSATSVATGNTASIDAGDILELGFIAHRNLFTADVTVSNFTSRAIGNVVQANGTEQSGRLIAGGWAQTSDAGTRATTGNWSPGNEHTGASALLAAFSTTEPATLSRAQRRFGMHY